MHYYIWINIVFTFNRLYSNLEVSKEMKIDSIAGIFKKLSIKA